METVRTDAQIQSRVIDELRWDSRVDATDIGVTVDHGVVTLTGTVDSYVKRLSAREAAHRVAGVLDVADDIVVRYAESGQRNDTDLAAAVRRALEWDALVPDRDIQSTVTDGGVTLTGKVGLYSQRQDAERAIRNLQGVKWVLNKIEVAAPKLEREAVRKAIEDALERHAERTANRIQLDVKDGHLTITGVAHSWGERRAIVGAAAATPGVIAVEDRLRVEA
jgi:osmotically-inducible protein OsmY